MSPRSDLFGDSQGEARRTLFYCGLYGSRYLLMSILSSYIVCMPWSQGEVRNGVPTQAASVSSFGRALTHRTFCRAFSLTAPATLAATGLGAIASVPAIVHSQCVIAPR